MKTNKIPLKNIMELFINLRVYENNPNGIFTKDIVEYSHQKRCQFTLENKKWIQFNQLDDSFIFDFIRNVTDIDIIGELQTHKYENIKDLVIKKHLDYNLSYKGGD